MRLGTPRVCVLLRFFLLFYCVSLSSSLFSLFGLSSDLEDRERGALPNQYKPKPHLRNKHGSATTPSDNGSCLSPYHLPNPTKPIMHSQTLKNHTYITQHLMQLHLGNGRLTAPQTRDQPGEVLLQRRIRAEACKDGAHGDDGPV